MLHRAAQLQGSSGTTDPARPSPSHQHRPSCDVARLSNYRTRILTMEVPQGHHSVLCTNCQNAKIQYRCLSWNPNNDHRFVTWDCEGCLPRIKEMGLDVGGRPVDMCEVCVASESGADIPPITPVYGVPSPNSTSDVSCTGCLELGAECEGLHIGSTRCMKCAQRDLDCDWRELNNTCGFCRTQHLKCVRKGDSCINRNRFVEAIKKSKQLQEGLKPGSTYSTVENTVPDSPVKDYTVVKEATATLPAINVSPPKSYLACTTDTSRTDCSNCRQHGVVCNVVELNDSNCELCEEQDIKCDKRKTCDYCKTRRLRCFGHGDSCANCLRFGLECKPLEQRKSDSQNDVASQENTSRYPPAKIPLGVNKPITTPLGYNTIPAKQFFEAEVERTGCRSCRKLGVICSRLHTTASKCESCLANDLDCDCTVKRRACQYCRRRRLRCLGNEDSCGNCLRFGQECKQSPQPDRRPLKIDDIEKKRQYAEERRQNTEKKRQYAPAQSPRDIIDGMRSTTSWQKCVGCAEDPLLRCDMESTGCGQCKARKQPCQYPPLAIADELPETNTRYCTTCYRPKSRLTPGPLCHRCMKAAEAKATTTPEPCHACRIMNTKCDTDAESCAPCQKLKFKCLRGPSFSQRPRYSTLCELRSLPPTSVNLASKWGHYGTPAPPAPAKPPISNSNRSNSPVGLNGASASTSRSQWSDIAGRCNKGPTTGSAEKTLKAPAIPPIHPNPLAKYLPKCDHVEGTDPMCLCGRGRSETIMKSAADFMLPPPPPPPLPLLTQVKNKDNVSHCKVGNDYCSERAPCYFCRNPSTIGAEPRTRKKARQTPYCDPCRLLKAKCGGGSPACTRCQEKGIDCVYTIGPIITLPKQGDAKQSAMKDCTILEKQIPEPVPVVAPLPAEVEKAVAKAMEDLDVEEDWCMVSSEDVDVIEEEPAEETTGWGYKFW
ncbi:hypothetical protein BDZ45DRAFT_726565 [Acephala macrosclerotiorum]|nr:hypothetical protein BDZ45DRAFT_726565 [Acephala macrosclerotiorum]